MKKLSTVVLLTALIAFMSVSCKSDKKERPDGFGMQGTYSSTTGKGGIGFGFGAAPNLMYEVIVDDMQEGGGTYEYNAVTDLLILHPTMAGTPQETYIVVWSNNYNTFKLTGGAKYKEIVFNRN